MTNDLQLSKEFLELETKLKRLLAGLDQMKKEKQNRLKFLQQVHDKLLKEIKAIRKTINDKLDEMQMIVEEVDTKIGAQVHDVSKVFDVISNEKITLERRQTSIENSRSNNKTDLFIQLKMGQADIQKSEGSSEIMGTGSHTMKIRILPDDNVRRLLESKNTALGKTSLILIPESTKDVCNVNVRLPSDKKICFITDICLTSDGNVYIADGTNARIKNLDQFYAVTDHLDLPDHTFGLCEVDNTRLAATLVSQKKVQFVSRNPLTLGDSFNVGDRCRGIDCHKGQLYVCCGGLRDEGNGPGHIEVYSIGGELLRSYYLGAGKPGCFHVSEGGDLVMSDGKYINLFTLRLIDSISDMQIKALREPVGMCRVGDSQLSVAGCASNNIVLISEDGEHQQELLTQKDGVTKPWAVCFNKQQHSLIVSLINSDTIKIFQVAT